MQIAKQGTQNLSCQNILHRCIYAYLLIQSIMFMSIQNNVCHANELSCIYYSLESVLASAFLRDRPTTFKIFRTVEREGASEYTVTYGPRLCWHVHQIRNKSSNKFLFNGTVSNTSATDCRSQFIVHEVPCSIACSAGGGMMQRSSRVRYVT